jgi:pyruvate-ferredoxin/flavodoxin oxidoreductase
MELLQEFRERALNPEHPVTRGTAQNPDIYFQSEKLLTAFMMLFPMSLKNICRKSSKLPAVNIIHLLIMVLPDAENIIIAMGSITETIKETIDYLKRHKARKLVWYQCSSVQTILCKIFLNVMPKTVKRIAVLDRTKEPGANGDPLYLDIVNVYGKPMLP